MDRSQRTQLRSWRSAYRVFLLSLCAALAATVVPASAQSTEAPPELTGNPWARQFGTKMVDWVGAVAATDDAVYAGGAFNSADPNGFLRREHYIAFLRKYDTQGDVLWTYEAGRGGFTWTEAVAAAPEGVYIAGSTNEDPDAPLDAFLHKVDHDGNVLWAQRLENGDGDVVTTGVAASGDRLYVSGWASNAAGDRDAFLRRYDTATGDTLWTRDFGTAASDRALGVAANAEAVFVVGKTAGSLGEESNAGRDDAFVRAYGHDGEVIWTRQFGAGDDEVAAAVSAVNDAVYVAGTLVLGQGNRRDAFVRRYDPAGGVIWADVIVTPRTDEASSVSATSEGAYVAGYTQGTLPGQTPNSREGVGDAFVRRYGSAGAILWTRQFGTSADDEAGGVSAGASGLYVGGETLGTFPGQERIGDDRLEPVSAPTDAFLVRVVRGARSIGLGPKLLRRYGIAQGRVELDEPACAQRVPVRIQRKPLPGGRWRVVRRPRTNTNGVFRTSKRILRWDGQPRPGRYRAVAVPFTFLDSNGDEVRCRWAVSPVRWVPRP